MLSGLKDLVWLWLWRRLAAAAPVQPLAWELPHAVGAAVKRKKERERERERWIIRVDKKDTPCGLQETYFKYKDNLIPLLYSGKIF